MSGIADRNPEKEDEEEKAQTRRRMNKEKEEAKNVPGAELAGYMPLRGEVRMLSNCGHTHTSSDRIWLYSLMLNGTTMQSSF